MLEMSKNIMMIAKVKFMQFCTNEKGDVNIVSIVVLIGIAVLLAVIFKDNIKELLEKLFNTITGTATNAVDPPAKTP